MRQPLVRDFQWPYYVRSRSNHADWFYVQQKLAWSLFKERLIQTSDKYQVWIHAFVLLPSEFHLVVTTPNSNLDRAMRFFKTEVSRDIGRHSNRINHIFGGRYVWCRLTSPKSIAHGYKYVLRTPWSGQGIEEILRYPYSSYSEPSLPTVERIDWAWREIPRCPKKRLQWLNKPVPAEMEDLVRKALRRKEFQFSRERRITLQLRRWESDYLPSSKRG